jgi:hypothetical protein
LRFMYGKAILKHIIFLPIIFVFATLTRDIWYCQAFYHKYNYFSIIDILYSCSKLYFHLLH